MSDHIYFDGERYISAADASQLVDLTRDYVARLCRDGRVGGKRVGKNWYIHEESLKHFITQQGRVKQQRREQLARERAHEYAQVHVDAKTEVARDRNSAEVTYMHEVDGVRPPVFDKVARIHEELREKALAGSARALAYAPAALAHPAGIHEAVARTISHAPMHVPVHAISPVAEFFHKLVALLLAFTMTFGTYALVDPTYAKFAYESISDNARSLAHMYERATGGGITVLARTSHDGLIFAAENPKAALAQVSSASVGSIPHALRTLARTINQKIDSFVYAVAFPDHVTRSTASSLNEASVSIEVEPYVSTSRAAQARANLSSAPVGADAQAPVDETNAVTVIERRIETERIVAAAGGITEDYLNSRLAQLEQSLRGSLTAAYGGGGSGYTTINNNYSVIAATNRIDKLGSVDIENSTYTGGTITGTSISDVTITGSSFAGSVAATTLSASATSSLATTTITGDLSVSGSFSVGSLSLSSASTTDLIFERATGTSATTTNLFSAVGRFTNGIIDTLTSTLATITGLTVTNSTTTNATTTNGYIANLSTDNATSTSLFSTTASSTNLFSSAAQFGSLSVLGALTQTGLGTFANGFLSQASSTIVGAFTNTGAATFGSTLAASGLATFTSGFISNASSTVVGNFTSTGTGAFGNGSFTSTSGTTTIAAGQGVTIGSTKFVVQESSGNIGIGTAAPTTGLDIGVTTRVTGDLSIAGGSAFTISASGPINQTGTGQVTFAGNVDATNGLDVTNANFTVGGNKFIVAHGSGNTTIAGSLGLTGAFSASSTLQTTGAAHFYSTLRANGAATFSAAGTGLSVTNNASIGGTLGLTGAATFGSTLSVAGLLSAATSTFTGDVALSGKKITGLGSPTADEDAANKTYVDSVAQGLSLKDSVVAATVANITLSGEQTVDGVALSVGDRVLVKNQADETKNGIYVVASGAWSRSTDADANDEVAAGMFAFVQDGTLNASSGWVLTTPGAITLGTSLLSFSQFSGAGQIIAGTGITKTGNTLDVVGTADRITANADSIDIASTYAGQSSITTVGALTSGSLGVGFGNINIGASSITGGVATFSSIVGSAINGTGDLSISGTGTFSNGLTIAGGTLSAGAASFSSNVALGGNKITGLADPTSAQEAATKAYVDAIAQGLTVKAAVRVATTSNITLSGEQTIDGVATVSGDRILVMGQSAASENGIYVVAAGAWSRSSDADENSEVATGMYAFVEEGAAYANTGWSLITLGAITLDTTSLSFTQFSGSAETTAGDGLVKSGNTLSVGGTAGRITVGADSIDIANTYTGQSSIVTVGTLTSGAIGSGFGAINIGSSALTAGAATLASATSYGSLLVGGTATTTISGNSATSTFSGGISLAGGNVNLATGGGFLINNILALNATSLGSNVVSSSLTSVGALNSGSITTGFGAINIGADTLDAGATTLASLSVSGGATSTSLFSTTASSTNLFSSAAQFGSLSVLGALTQTGLGTFANGFLSQASSTIVGAFTNTGAATFGSTLAVSGASTFSGLVSSTNASTSLLSVFSKAYFGGTATSTFDSAGALSLVSNGLTVGTNQLVVSDGNVGIGSTTPNAKLVVSGDMFLDGSSRYINFGLAAQGANGYGFRDNAGTLEFKNSAGSWTGIGTGGGSGYPFGLAGNATSTLTQFNGGLTAFASSTIGGGTQDSGLTISGGATTTGSLAITGTSGTTTIASGQGFTVGGSQFVVQQGSGNVGIGTSAPSTALHVVGSLTFDNGAGQTSAFSMAFPATVQVSGGAIRNPNNGYWYLQNGASASAPSYSFKNDEDTGIFNSATDGIGFSVGGSQMGAFTTSGFGIGTTSPFRKLSITDAVATAQVAISYDTTRNTEILTDSSGDVSINPSGDDVRLTDDNMWVCASGSCPSGTPSGTGNLIVETALGVGTSTPLWPVTASYATSPQLALTDGSATSDAWTFRSISNSLYIATSTASATSTQSALVITPNGRVGIGTTTPTQQLSVQGLLQVGAGSNAGLTMGLATSTFNGDVKIIGKLDVSTIDPPYTIDGIKYATYVPSMTGVKEETTQVIYIDQKDANGKYSYSIHFDSVEKGSDLWLFYQITDFGASWQHLSVLLTPAFDGKVFYKKVPEKNQLIIYSDAQGEVSMRLTGNRYDFSKWPNLRPDQDGDTAGTHVISSKPHSAPEGANIGNTQ